MAHCELIVATIAYPEHPTGIDIEHIDNKNFNILKAQMTIDIL